MPKLASNLKARVERQQAFQARKTPGDLLIYVNRDRSASLEAFLCAQLAGRPVPEVLARPSVKDLIATYARSLR
ncbi:MAG: hypothetical protein Q8P60_02995, partial [Pseudorhodobacter sp.]|nr:hypothetical protein [Pseudorhodobacter sp.]